MDYVSEDYYCRVCGLDQGEPRILGEICPCCGSEFGHDDFNLNLIKTQRAKWLLKADKWDVPDLKPPNWNYKEQMKNISKQYL